MEHYGAEDQIKIREFMEFLATGNQTISIPRKEITRRHVLPESWRLSREMVTFTTPPGEFRYSIIAWYPVTRLVVESRHKIPRQLEASLFYTVLRSTYKYAYLLSRILNTIVNYVKVIQRTMNISRSKKKTEYHTSVLTKTIS